MLTKITSWRNQHYKLVLDLPRVSIDKLPVVACASNYEGTGCWRVEDQRLAPHRLILSPYFGGAAEDFCSHFTAKTEAEAAYLRSTLREFIETPQDNGEITFKWCTYSGIVRGQTELELMNSRHTGTNFSVIHKFSDVKAKLNEIQAFWNEWLSTKPPEQALKEMACIKIKNPYLQPSESRISMNSILARRNINIESEPTAHIERGG